jgi:PASTA domain
MAGRGLRHGRWQAACATGLALLSLGAGVALAAPAVDQQQPTIDANQGSPIGGPSDTRVAQVITAGMAGALTEVRLAVWCRPSDTLAVEIRRADPSLGTRIMGELLAAQAVPGSQLPEPVTGLRSIVLSSPPFIARDVVFAVTLRTGPGGRCGVHGGARGDSYPRGHAYSAYLPNPLENWYCICDPARDFYDLAFQTLVEAMCGVPDVQTQHATLSEAQQTISRHGCTTGQVTRRYSSTVPVGLVISQTPPPDTRLPSAGAVNLVVSRGPSCTVPRVVGMTLRRAKARIRAARCSVGRVRTQRRGRRGRVISQRPRPGATLPLRSKVNLVVGARR